MKTAAVLAFWNSVRVAFVAAVMFLVFTAIGVASGAATLFLLS